MTALQIESVGVRIGKRRLISEVGMEVAVGEWVGIVGPNGAGKTTLLRAVAGQVKFEGVVQIGGEDSRKMSSTSLAKAVAVVPQRPVHPPGMRVIDYTLLGRTPHLGLLGREAREDVEHATSALAMLDVEHLAGRTIDTLSGGEAQRVVIARSLTQNAPLLLLDEPTSSLDIGHGQQVLSLIDSFRRTRDLTVVAAMHDLTTASQFCDRLFLMSTGKVVGEGRAELVLTRENIKRYYGAEVEVERRSNGGIVVIPVRGGSTVVESDVGAAL